MAKLITVEITANSAIYTKGEEFMTFDIKRFYLNTTLIRYEYIRLKLKHFPKDVIKY